MRKEKLQPTWQKYKGSLGDYRKKLYANKMDNLEEMDKFLEIRHSNPTVEYTHRGKPELKETRVPQCSSQHCL